MKYSRFIPVWLFATCATLSAANWPGFRGPNQDGSSPETGLPEKFSKTDGIKWATDMPGPAASVPAVWEIMCL
ncbi:hypothetical protein [Verrucomicrobium spinosum]|uniref:hypothetical protein n=1 Tax=Verrucomicrobium spinosum TaxID=2736 RepID=UPI000946179C|nr:hypothetical protein [Verrucomicrobium spinosum]